MNIVTFIQNSLKKAILSQRETESIEIEKIGENLTPNMRALRLSMGLADQLLSMGAAASDVVHMSLGVTNTYCTRKVHIDISHNLITISQDRGVDRAPLTLIRSVVARSTNYQTIQKLQQLANAIRDKRITLTGAEKEFAHILANQKIYPEWVRCLTGGGVSAGVSILYGGSLTIIFISFFIGIIITWGLRQMRKLGIPSFYIQVAAALFATLVAGGLSWIINGGHLDIISHINPTLIIISGIVLLVAGMMIVGALQDAIDEYYVTAGARILKVIMLTGGIVMGVAMGLYITKRFDINFVATPDGLSFNTTALQYTGAAIIASMFALGNHSRLGGVILAGAIGILGYYCAQVGLSLGLGPIPAYGIAAAVIGFSATMISRIWRVPSLASISAGIIPLVPGLTLYNGLMQVIQNPPGNPYFDKGLAILLQAFLIALTIAAGASFGNIAGRPMRRKLINIHNKLPGHRLRSPSKKRIKPQELNP